MKDENKQQWGMISERSCEAINELQVLVVT